MKTEHIIIKSEGNKEGIKRVADILRKGGIAAIPTETVYGLAADATNAEAVAKIFAAKGRPQDNPLIVHISSMEMLEGIVSQIPEGARELAKKYWPGPLTVIMPRGSAIPKEVSAGLDTVAVRFPSHNIARAIIEETGLPLAAPSANLSGSPSPTTAAHCIADLETRVDAIVISNDCEVGVESTVVSLCTNPPRLLRPGAVTVEQLEAVLGEIVIDKAVTAEPQKGEAVASPGMKYKHYSPKTEVILIRGTAEQYRDFVNSKRQENAVALCFQEDSDGIEIPTLTYGKADDEMSLANGIFAALRNLDSLDADVAYAHSPELSGVGLAVYNRLIRAAAFREKILDAEI